MGGKILKKKIAVAVFSFDRPVYFKKVLDSLEQNLDLGGMDFYAFQDGAINKFSKRIAADEKDIAKCVALWDRAKLPNKVLMRRTENVGIGISQFEAKCLLFDKLKYDEVVFMEDDLLLSRNYLRLIRTLLDQFRDDKYVGAVTCHGGEADRIYSKKEKSEILYKLKMGRPNLWGWATWRDRWVKVKPHFLKYFEFIKDIDYKLRPDKLIKFFFMSEGLNLRFSSQDSGMYYALFRNDLFVLNTFVNRAKYIGARGEHMTPKLFQKTIFPSIKLDEFSEDATVMKFDDFDKAGFLEGYGKTFVLTDPRCQIKSQGKKTNSYEQAKRRL